MQASAVNIVSKSLEDGRVDERAMRSLNTLAERLQRLKQSNPAFAAVSFSVDVERMIEQRHTVAVG